MRNELILSVTTSAEASTSWEVGERILSPLFDHPRLSPQKIAVGAEINSRNAFQVSKVAECKDCWGVPDRETPNGRSFDAYHSLDWRGSKEICSNGHVSFPVRTRHGRIAPGSVSLVGQAAREVDWVELFQTWCAAARATSGLLHISPFAAGSVGANRLDNEPCYQDEVSQLAWSRFLVGTLETDFRAGESNTLVKGLTNIGYATFFGGQLAKEVDVDRITAAGFRVIEMDHGYLVQVSDGLFDLIDDFERFSKRRAHLKSLFREDLFLIREEPTLARV